MNAIEVLFLLTHGKKQKRHFKTEDEAVDYLIATHATEAPIAFHYTDGSALGREDLERIYDRVFKGLGTDAARAVSKRKSEH